MPPHNTDDVRIRELKELIPPAHLIREFPCTEAMSDLVRRMSESKTGSKAGIRTKRVSNAQTIDALERQYRIYTAELRRRRRMLAHPCPDGRHCQLGAGNRAAFDEKPPDCYIRLAVLTVIADTDDAPIP